MEITEIITAMPNNNRAFPIIQFLVLSCFSVNIEYSPFDAEFITCGIIFTVTQHKINTSSKNIFVIKRNAPKSDGGNPSCIKTLIVSINPFSKVNFAISYALLVKNISAVVKNAFVIVTRYLISQNMYASTILIIM